MSTTQASQIDQVCERVDRLLLRHQELLRTNGLLEAQVEALARERDSLKSRLGAARARIDSLLERLPAPSPATPASEVQANAGDDASNGEPRS